MFKFFIFELFYGGVSLRVGCLGCVGEIGVRTGESYHGTHRCSIKNSATTAKSRSCWAAVRDL